MEQGEAPARVQGPSSQVTTMIQCFSRDRHAHIKLESLKLRKLSNLRTPTHPDMINLPCLLFRYLIPIYKPMMENI